MRFPTPLLRGRLLRRYKRFLADVELDAGGTVTAACPNTGSMIGLTDPGNAVWLSVSGNPARKYPYTWEMLEHRWAGFVGINTNHPNRLAGEALEAGLVPGVEGYASRRAEVRYGRNSRIDWLLEGPDRPPCYLEVKNVHMFREPGLAEFPDCVTERGAKHLDEMSAMVRKGARATMLYMIQSAEPRRFLLAGDLDPHYLARYRRARKIGVEAVALCCKVGPEGISVSHAIPVVDTK